MFRAEVRPIAALIPLAGASTLELLSYDPPGWGAVLLYGLRNSIIIAAGAYGIGLLIGICGAFGKLYGGPMARDLLAVYTTVIRAVPELVLILILYFAGTDLVNRLLELLGRSPIDINGLVAGIGVLGVVQGAYSTEVLRGAILSISQGEIEAARAVGMPLLTSMRRIILPAMLPFAIPGLANLWLIATKDTALLAVVGFSELTQVTRQAAGTTKAYFTFFVAAGVLYLCVTLVSNVVLAPCRAPGAAGHAPSGRPAMSGEMARLRRADRVWSWMQPHRVVLILVTVGLAVAAAVFMRWDWLPDYAALAVEGLWRTIWLLGDQRRAGLCSRRADRPRAGDRSVVAAPAGTGVLHGHPRHAAAAAIVAALLRAGVAVPAVSLDPRIRSCGPICARPGPMACWR